VRSFNFTVSLSLLTWHCFALALMATNFSTSVISDGMDLSSYVSSLRWMQDHVFICFGATCKSGRNDPMIATLIFIRSVCNITVMKNWA
jgi:hypothetical protein